MQTMHFGDSECGVEGKQEVRRVGRGMCADAKSPARSASKRGFVATSALHNVARMELLEQLVSIAVGLDQLLHVIAIQGHDEHV